MTAFTVNPASLRARAGRGPASWAALVIAFAFACHGAR